MLIEITYNVTDVYMSTTETPVYVEISFEQPGGTSAVWGSITGTLSNQTDLQNALNAKLDESTIDGGTEGQILSKASGTDFDFAWINNYAKYLATNVRNQSGSTIAAFQVVYISGATGNKPLISLADADTEATSSKTYGVTATSIANNSTGDVVTAGELSGINTSAFNEGDLLWLSTTAGGVVTTPPAEPAHAVFIGTVIRSHPTLGVIDVAIANGYELNELHGVQITSAANNDGLFYETSSALWKNKSITTALGFTPVPTSRTITINGVTFDLSADRTYTISAGISGSGAAGQVTYWTGASAVSGSNNLFWDNTNGRLGIGTNAPSTTLDIRGKARIETTGTTELDMFGGGGNILRISCSSTTPFIGTLTNAPLGFFTSATERGRFTTNGNLMLGTTSDLGVRLGVVGDTLLRGSGATSATTALTVQNSSSTNLFTVRNDGLVTAHGAVQLNGIVTIGGVGLYQSLDGGYVANAAGRVLRYETVWGSFVTSPHSFSYNLFSAHLGTATEINHSNYYGQFNPTSGTKVFNIINIAPAINQTGGANGITRGLYVNPTLTNAADFRAIETARGNIVFSNLPTSSAGLPSGALWNNGGVINIV